MSGWSNPWLHKFHRNFFIIYSITMVFNFWAAINGLFGSHAWFDARVLTYVNYMNPEAWGLLYLVTGIAMLLGLFRKDFTLARLALAGGLFVSASRFILIVLATLFLDDSAGANVLPNLLVVVGVYVSQLLEPPVNPSSIR